MNLRMAINGKDIAEWGLTSLNGNLNTLIKPAPFKKLVTNENASVHGSLAITDPATRKKQKQDLSLLFLCKANSLIDLERTIITLENYLLQGKDSTGVNEVVVPELGLTLYLVYNNISKYTNFGDPTTSGRATITISFNEPNPNNRTIV